MLQMAKEKNGKGKRRRTPDSEGERRRDGAEKTTGSAVKESENSDDPRTVRRNTQDAAAKTRNVAGKMRAGGSRLSPALPQGRNAGHDAAFAAPLRRFSGQKRRGKTAKSRDGSHNGGRRREMLRRRKEEDGNEKRQRPPDGEGERRQGGAEKTGCARIYRCSRR